MVTSGAVSFDERLSTVLVEGGFINRDQLEEARRLSAERGTRLLDVLVDRGFVSRETIVTVLSFQLKIPVVDLRNAKVDPEAVNLVPEEYASEHVVLPFAFDTDGSLRVATLMPHNFETASALSNMTGKQIKFVFALGGDLQELIHRTYSEGRARHTAAAISSAPSATAASPAPRTAGFANGHGGAFEPKSGVLGNIAQESAVEAVERLTQQAVRRRVSDIHLRATPQAGQILFRLDGELQHVSDVPSDLYESMVSRIKVLAQMDISETRRPQDGGFSAPVGNRTVDFRVSTAGTAWGELMVMRVLDRAGGLLGLEDLGLRAQQLQTWRNLLSLPYGLLLVSGPTGSGKSTTLYASVRELVGKRGNIITVEDPIEYRLETINQIQVNRQAGIDFAAGLRAVMRLDPDVILIGEVRDTETARIAVDAALTGHLVFASIHSHDATSAIVRLLDLGAEPFLVASAAAGVLGQRLVRKICDHCRTETTLSTVEQVMFEQETQKSAEGVTFYQGRGCNFCFGTGFSSRIGVFEVYGVSEDARKLIAQSENNQQLRDLAVSEGMIPMRRSGLLMAEQGTTTVGEVLSKVYTFD